MFLLIALLENIEWLKMNKYMYILLLLLLLLLFFQFSLNAQKLTIFEQFLNHQLKF